MQRNTLHWFHASLAYKLGTCITLNDFSQKSLVSTNWHGMRDYFSLTPPQIANCIRFRIYYDRLSNLRVGRYRLD